MLSNVLRCYLASSSRTLNVSRSARVTSLTLKDLTSSLARRPSTSPTATQRHPAPLRTAWSSWQTFISTCRTARYFPRTLEVSTPSRAHYPSFRLWSTLERLLGSDQIPPLRNPPKMGLRRCVTPQGPVDISPDGCIPGLGEVGGPVSVVAHVGAAVEGWLRARVRR